jgi:hypothetical protein
VGSIDNPMPPPVTHGMVGHDRAGVAHDDATGEHDQPSPCNRTIAVTSSG